MYIDTLEVYTGEKLGQSKTIKIFDLGKTHKGFVLKMEAKFLPS